MNPTKLGIFIFISVVVSFFIGMSCLSGVTYSGDNIEKLKVYKPLKDSEYNVPESTSEYDFKKVTIPICWSKDKDGNHFISTYIKIFKINNGVEEEIDSKIILIPVKSIFYNGKKIVDVDLCY